MGRRRDGNGLRKQRGDVTVRWSASVTARGETNVSQKVSNTARNGASLVSVLVGAGRRTLDEECFVELVVKPV